MRTLILIAALCLTASCHKKPPPLPPRSYAVEVGKAVEKEVPLYIEALGHVESITSIDIRSRIEGELTGVYFQQGQEVRAGDLLFTIDPKPYEAELKQAQGSLDQTLANLVLAEEKLKRYRTLANDEYYSQIDYETLQADYAALLAQREENQGRLDLAKINLDYCWIYAPIDGMTGILQIDYGNLVSADGNTPLVNLTQIAPIFVTFSVPEIQLPHIQKALKKSAALKTLSAYEEFTDPDAVEGRLFMIDNQVDPHTGMIKLRALYQNENRSLWPGQFIRTRLILEELPHAVIIPFTAIQMTQKGPVIFIVKEDMTVEQRFVKLGQRQEADIVILEGVKAGEQIVTEGQLNLFDKARVFTPRKASP